MKSTHEVTACVVDYGTFLSVAEKLAESYSKVYYYSPFQVEYQGIRDVARGSGIPNVERIDEFYDKLESIDLFVFPDIGFGDLQRHLRRLGKAVFGHMGADELELFRDDFLKTVKKAGLAVPKYEVIVGLNNLAAYLREHENCWVKINRFRGNMETWHHNTYAESLPMLESLVITFGGVRDQIVFVVVDDLPTSVECGYDGMCIDGMYPVESFQGYEKKNELYLGSVIRKDRLPEPVRVVNEKFAPVLAKYGYRNWFSTEIRVVDGVPYFIDPTPRMAGQTAEHQLETINNLAEVIWYGANGIVVPPQFAWKFAAEATLHHTLEPKDDSTHDAWKSLEIPKNVRRWVKLYNYCVVDGVYHFPLEGTDEVGVVVGVGDSPIESLQHLMKNLKLLKDVPVEARTLLFLNLVKSIHAAEANGIGFGGSVPTLDETLKVVLA